VHQAGKLHVYLLPQGHAPLAAILRGMSFDCLLGVDPRMLQGGDLRSLSGALGGRKSFWGGVDAEVTLASGDRRRIAEAVRRAIEELGSGGGLILGSLLFLGLDAKNLQMMVDAWKECLR